MCVTLQIYLELDNANWNLKFKPLKLQAVISIWALESPKNVYQLIVINFQKSLLHHCFSRVRILHFVRNSFIIFFVF